jgi:hypothetical protein
MNNRKRKKGIKMSFIQTSIENGYTRRQARRLFKLVKARKVIRIKMADGRIRYVKNIQIHVA